MCSGTNGPLSIVKYRLDATLITRLRSAWGLERQNQHAAGGFICMRIVDKERWYDIIHSFSVDSSLTRPGQHTHPAEIRTTAGTISHSYSHVMLGKVLGQVRLRPDSSLQFKKGINRTFLLQLGA